MNNWNKRNALWMLLYAVLYAVTTALVCVTGMIHPVFFVCYQITAGILLSGIIIRAFARVKAPGAACFLGAGMLWHADEAALLLIFALLGFSAELFFCRRHPWATILWTAVGLLPFWIDLTVGGIDRSDRYLMIVIGLTAAAFGLFLTYRNK